MKTKRIFALILTIAMALSLAACGTKETTCVWHIPRVRAVSFR